MKIKILLIILLLIPSICSAETWLSCSFAGGQWINNECVYPKTIEAPDYYEAEELTEPNIQDAIFTLGPDSYNSVLAQYEMISLEFKETIRFTKAVDVTIVIKIDGFPLLWLKNDMSLTFCPSTAFINTKIIPAKTIMQPVLVSDIFSTYKGWIGVGIDIHTTGTCFYHTYIYWIYIA